MSDIRDILEGVSDGSVSIDEALLKLKMKPFEDIGYAKVDMHRKLRQGAAEVIYGAGKTPEQIIGIADAMLKNGQKTILITRLSAEAAGSISVIHPLQYHKDARCGVIGEMPASNGMGKPVAEVHFHEVGTMDAIADITAVCLLMQKIGPEQVEV